MPPWGINKSKQETGLGLLFVRSCTYAVRVAIYTTVCMWPIAVRHSRSYLAIRMGNIFLYMSLPYELDANTFAYERTKEICGDTDELQELHAFWCPKERTSYDEHIQLFHRIDGEVTR